MKIYTDVPEGMTVVQNAFIDRFMPHANGEFVKVYLYLLRCADSGQELSVASIADVFDHTEKDVRRALSYWERQHLMKLKLSSEGEFLSVTFLVPPTEEYGAALTDEFADQRRAGIVPDRQAHPAGAGAQEPGSNGRGKQDMPTRERVAALAGQEEIKQLFFIAEQYLDRALSSEEQRELVYCYDTLHFSADLIEYLLEYCISKGSKSHYYMHKVALGWAEAGVTTVLQAKQETNLYNKNYYTVLNAFGIKNRGPALPEQETMSRWFNEWGFSIELVLEACKRTINQTRQPSFSYADSILKKWHENGAVSMEDVGKLDKRREQVQKKPDGRQAKSAANRFTDVPQRTYDFQQLEKNLLKK